MLEHPKVLVTGEWLSLRFLAGKPAPEVHQELVSGRFGRVVRLGDMMPRPTLLDYDLSMVMKDVYMVPKDQEKQVLGWLEPEALERIAEQQSLQRQVEELQTLETSRSPSQHAGGGRTEADVRGAAAAAQEQRWREDDEAAAATVARPAKAPTPAADEQEAADIRAREPEELCAAHARSLARGRSPRGRRLRPW